MRRDWTTAEVRRLREHEGSRAAIAAELGRSEASVAWALRAHVWHGRRPDVQPRLRWAPAEDEILRETARRPAKESIAALARAGYRRGEASVRSRRHKLGLSGAFVRRVWTPEEREWLYRGPGREYGHRAAAAHLGRSEWSVRSERRRRAAVD